MATAAAAAKKQASLKQNTQTGGDAKGGVSLATVVGAILVGIVVLLFVVGTMIDQYEYNQMLAENPALECNAETDLSKVVACNAQVVLQHPDKCAVWDNLGQAMMMRVKTEDGSKHYLIGGQFGEMKFGEVFQKALTCDFTSASYWHHVANSLEMGQFVSVPGAPVVARVDVGEDREVGSEELFSQEDCLVRSLELDDENAEAWIALALLRGEGSPTVLVSGTSYTQYDILLKSLEVEFWSPSVWRLVAQKTAPAKKGDASLSFEYKGESYDHKRSKAMFYEAKKRKNAELDSRFSAGPSEEDPEDDDVDDEDDE